MSRTRSSLWRVWMRCLVFEVCRRAEQDQVAAGCSWPNDAFVTNPSRRRCHVGIVAELGLVAVIFIRVIIDIGVREDLHPWSIPLENDYFVPWRHQRNFLSIRIGGNIDICIVQYRSARYFVIVLGLLLGFCLAN